MAGLTKSDITRIEKIANGYINDVLSGKITAGRFVKMACQRHLEDLKHGPARGLEFKPEMGARAVKFFSYLRLWKGSEYKGKPFDLAPHMVFITWSLMGWYRTSDNKRRFRKSYIEMARKGAKAESIENEIPTPSGFKKMADIHPGDYVFGSNGQPVLVVGETEIMTGKKCSEVSFSSGERVVVSEDHLWKVNKNIETENQRKPWTDSDDNIIKESYQVGGANLICQLLPYRSRYALQKRVQALGIKKENGRHNREVHKLDKPREQSMPLIPGIIDTKTIMDTLRYGTRQDLRYSIDVAPAIILFEKKLLIPCYTLGVWLGDGNSSGSRITVSYDDLDVIKRIENDGYFVKAAKKTLKNCGNFAIGSFKHSKVCRRGHEKIKYRTKNGGCLFCNRIIDKAKRKGLPIPPHTEFSFYDNLVKIGVINNKHIPMEYFLASKDQRLGLLQGLMDSDGHADKRGRCSFTNCNKVLAYGVRELLSTLGIKSTITTRKATLYGRVISDVYKVDFAPADGIQIFGLKRKQDRIRSRTKKTRSDTRMITKVQPVPSVPVKCITVDSADGLYLTGRSYIPTHNSTYIGALESYFFIADGEEGAEIYSAATTREQAKIVWTNVVNLTKKSVFAKRITYFTHNLSIRETNSKCEPLSSDAKSLDGLDTHFASLDELHAHPTREVHDLVCDSTGARSQPMIAIITTAGFNQTGICYETRDYVATILKNVGVENGFNDDSIFGIIYTLDTKKDWPDLHEAKEELLSGELHEDDWTNEDVWVKAAPGLIGISESGKKYGFDSKGIPVPGYMTKLEDMRDKARVAKQMPSALNNFLTKRLSIWTQQENRWLDLTLWDQNNIRPVTEETCRGRLCYGGIDLSAVSDMTVWVMLFPDEKDKDLVDILIRVWCPEKRLTDTRNKYREQYQVWAKQGYLTVTDGDAMDYDFIRGNIAGYTNKDGVYIQGDKDKFNIESMSVDRGFQGYEFSQKLDKELGGTEKKEKVIACGMGWLSMNGPCQELERLLLLKKLNHGGNPILRWFADNVSVKINPTGGGMSPNKASSQGKIDGIVGILLSLDRKLRMPGIEVSAYEQDDVEIMCF